jgi:hypothetical protein
MTRKHAGFTDLRILGGSRQRGGGVDADPRIKLPPVMSLCVALCHRRHRTHVLGSSLCVWLCAFAAVAHVHGFFLCVWLCALAAVAHVHGSSLCVWLYAHAAIAHVRGSSVISLRVAVCPRRHCTRARLIFLHVAVRPRRRRLVTHLMCSAHLYVCGYAPSPPSHVRARLVSVWLPSCDACPRPSGAAPSRFTGLRSYFPPATPPGRTGGDTTGRTQGTAMDLHVRTYVHRLCRVLTTGLPYSTASGQQQTRHSANTGPQGPLLPDSHR